MDNEKLIVFIRSTEIYNDSRATKEIIALARAGYKLKVLGWDRNGCAHENCQAVFKEYSESVQFSFFEHRLVNIGLKNLKALLNWFKWVRTNLQNMRNITAVHACDLDAGMEAYHFCKKKKVPLVYDIYDYYIDSHHIPVCLNRIVENKEIRIINFASNVIICTEARKSQIAKAKPKKLSIIHNSPDVQNVQRTAIKYDYVYCGLLSDNRLIYEILEDYDNNSDLTVKFVGHGKYAEKAKLMAEKYPNFHFQGDVRYSQVLEIESSSLALSAIYNCQLRNHRLCAPNKFYEALALKKPVIVCQGTGIDEIVAQNNIGYVISYKSEEFYQALRQIKKDSVLSCEMGERARKLYDEKYSWDIMAKRLILLYETINKNEKAYNSK